MNVLVVGKAKTGTTVISKAIHQALPGARYHLEPKAASYFEEHGGGGGSDIVKIIFEHWGGRPADRDALVDNRLAMRFDRRVFIVRDPRDEAISRLLYLAYPWMAKHGAGRRTGSGMPQVGMAMLEKTGSLFNRVMDKILTEHRPDRLIAGAKPLGARLPRRAAAPRRELSGKVRVDRQPATSPLPRATTHVRDELMVHDKKVGPVRYIRGGGSVRGPAAPARMAELPDGPARGRSRRDPAPSEQRRPVSRECSARAGLAAPRRRDAAHGEEGGGDGRSRCARHTSANACRA